MPLNCPLQSLPRLFAVLGLLAACQGDATGRSGVGALPPGAHPEMEYNREHNRGQGGYTRAGWTSSGTLLPHQFNLVSAPHPVRYGTHSERFEIRPTDDDGMSEITEANRSELLQRPGPDNPRIGEDNWFGWSFYQEEVPIVDWTYGWFPMFGQWKTDLDAPPVISISPVHDSAPGGGSYMGVSLNDYTSRQDRAWREANLFGQPCRLFSLAETRGQWVDVVINTDFGMDESGYLNVWINGEQRCAYRGIISVTPVDRYVSYGVRNEGPIHKRGYWSGHNSFPQNWRENHPDVPIPTIVVYYDEWRQGRSREEVDIRLIEARGGPPLD